MLLSFEQSARLKDEKLQLVCTTLLNLYNPVLSELFMLLEICLLFLGYIREIAGNLHRCKSS